MIIDKRLEFGDFLALNTGVAGSYIIGDQADLSIGRDLGGDQTLYLVVMVEVQPTSGGAATLQINLITDDNAPMASPAILLQSRVFSLAQMTPGAVLMCVPLPVEGPVPYERFLGIQQVTGVAAFTGGRINAFLTATPPQWKAYDAPFQL